MDEGCRTARRERKDAQRNLERVLNAAQALFAERGAEVTMEEVARRAGVGVGTIYRRFPSKEQLFAAVSHAACDHTRHCRRSDNGCVLGFRVTHGGAHRNCGGVDFLEGIYGHNIKLSVADAEAALRKLGREGEPR